MSNILEISTWNQLVRARSDYENLRILVVQWNSEKLIGTQIKIVDYNTNDVYFAGFVNDIDSTVVPETCTIGNSAMLDIINNFGFNVRFSPPTVLANNVVTILQGLYASGYRYIYKDYIRCHGEKAYGIYASAFIDKRKWDPDICKIPEFIADEWDWCVPFKSYPIIDLIENGTVNNGIPMNGNPSSPI